MYLPTFHMPNPSTGPKIFLAGQFFVLTDRKLIFILCRPQTFFARPKHDFHLCLVLLQVRNPFFELPKCFVARPKIEVQLFNATPKILCRHKN